MKLNKEDLLLYGVTDSKYLKGRKMSELVEEAILGGVTMIQLREKEMTHEAFKQEALDVQSVCQKHHIPLIINDDVELCKEIDADGVHIGQDDLNLKEARKILGEDYRRNIPCSFLLGAVLLTYADIAARMLFNPYETPIGVFTALIGIPFFIAIARKERG